MFHETTLPQGAEALVMDSEYQGQPCIIKTRVSKSYRHPILDAKLIKSRLQTESRILAKARKIGLPVPLVYKVIDKSIYMEKIHGQMLKSALQDASLPRDSVHAFAKQIGLALHLLHSKNMIHGDLTTSNMMVKENSMELVLIDFGLSFTSGSIEDKAVDLYVLERAIHSTHPHLSPWFFEQILESYGDSQVLKRLEKGILFIFVVYGKHSGNKRKETISRGMREEDLPLQTFSRDQLKDSFAIIFLEYTVFL